MAQNLGEGMQQLLSNISLEMELITFLMFLNGIKFTLTPVLSVGLPPSAELTDLSSPTILQVQCTN